MPPQTNARPYGAQPDTRAIFLPRLPQGGEGRGEEANVYKHEPLAPALSPFGGERGLFSFGAGIKMHPYKAVRAPLIAAIAAPS
jgi:hypothetical protein